MLGLSIMYGYIALLCALIGVNRERGPMRRTLWTLFAVMVAGYGYHYLAAQDWTYSAFMIAVNAIACRIIVKEPAGQWQGLVGWAFIIQIGADTGRIVREINSGPSDMSFLYWVTTAIAFAQLFLVIGWGIHDHIARERRSRLPHSLLPAKAGHAGGS